jgi:hypothetical protein
MEANCVDVRLMALETLHALARPNVPNQCMPIRSARNENVARVRLGNVDSKNCRKLFRINGGFGYYFISQTNHRPNVHGNSESFGHFPRPTKK